MAEKTKDVSIESLLKKLEEMEAKLEETEAKAESAKGMNEAKLTSSQKQVVLERNIHAVMAKAKKDTVKITLPLLPGADDEVDAYVNVNGTAWKVKRGEEVEVPRCVAEVFRNADVQKKEARERRADLQKKAEKE